MELFDALPTLNLREEIITSDNSTFEFLRFARIVLDPNQGGYAPITVKLADEEAVFYVNRGKAILQVNGNSETLIPGDVLYVGTGETVDILSTELCDVSEFRAVKCTHHYPVQLIRHKDIEGSSLAAHVGTKRPMTKRTVFKMVDGSNVQACRLLFGDTFVAQPGGVGSYPPHFHGPDGPFGLGKDAKEEIYHFRVASDIPNDTGYVMQNCGRPGEAVGAYVHIFDEQAINVTPVYHDTLAPPSMEYMFTWCLASFTENHRDWSQVLNKPGYDGEW
jgi:4-deoxy-L-threo-5-hexosulose-uronate ketol-isomerase